MLHHPPKLPNLDPRQTRHPIWVRVQVSLLCCQNNQTTRFFEQNPYYWSSKLYNKFSKASLTYQNTRRRYMSKISSFAYSTHIATEYDAAYMSNKILLALLNTYYPKSVITLTNIQFFIPSKKLGSQFTSQFLHPLAFLSKLALSIPFEPLDRVMYWSNTVFHAKILLQLKPFYHWEICVIQHDWKFPIFLYVFWHNWRIRC